MSYYLKHLFRIVKSKPLQPILIIFILTVSCIMSLTTFITSISLRKEGEFEIASKVGNSQLVLDAVSSSGSRFITIKDVEDVYEDAETVGTFTLPYLYKDSILSGIGCDFESLESLFPLELFYAEDIKRSELNSSIIVSSNFASKYEISLGDKIQLSLFGKNVEYTVKGINKYTFFGTNDVLVDMSGIISILSENMSIVSILGDNIQIYNTIYVKTNLEDSEAKALFQEKMPNALVTLSKEVFIDGDVGAYVSMAYIFVVVCSIFAFAVVFGCSYCLGKERAEFSYLFSLAGFSEKKLLLYKILEVVIYWIIGIGIGTVISIPIGRMMINKIGLIFAKYEFDFISLLICYVGLFIASTLSPILLNKKIIKKHKIKFNTNLFIIILSLITAIVFLITILINSRIKLYIGIVGIVLAVLIVMVLSVELLKGIGKRVNTKNTIKVLSYKNCEKVGELSNSCRLLSVLVSIIVMTAFLFDGCNSAVYTFSNFLKCDYVIAGANEEVRNIVESLDEVESVNGLKIASNTKLEGDIELAVWAFESIDNIDPQFGIERLPNNNEFVFARKYIENNGYDCDRELTVNLVSKDLVITNVLNCNNLGIMSIGNYDDFSDSSTYYLVTKKGGITDTQLYSKLTEVLSSKMVSIMTPNQIANYFIRNNQRLVFFSSVILIMLIVFGIIGIGDNFIESYRSRKDEFYSFNISGMSRKNIRKLITCEYLNIIIECLVLGLVFGLICGMFSEEAMIQFGGRPLMFILARLRMIYL